MEAITNKFFLPMMPKQPVVQKTIYPWEQTNLFVLCQELYAIAIKTGYNGTFDDFKENFGEYLESGTSMIDYDKYTGQYQVTPLPTIQQILRTTNKMLQHDIIIDPIPYHQTTNEAGGYTVTIG